MKETFQEVIAFIKNPVLEKDPNTTSSYRLKKFFHLLIISIISGVAFTPIFGLIEELGLVNMDDHAVEELMKNFSKPMILLLGAVLAPILEELIFRAPITLFTRRKSFKIAFYVFTVLFGLVHISNFTMTTNVLLLTPILVAPQLLVGAYFGFIRTKFNLGWSMLLHGTYNGILMCFAFAADIF